MLLARALRFCSRVSAQVDGHKEWQLGGFCPQTLADSSWESTSRHLPRAEKSSQQVCAGDSRTRRDKAQLISRDSAPQARLKHEEQGLSMTPCQVPNPAPAWVTWPSQAGRGCYKLRCPGILFGGGQKWNLVTSPASGVQKFYRSDSRAWGVQSTVHSPVQRVLLHFCL